MAVEPTRRRPSLTPADKEALHCRACRVAALAAEIAALLRLPGDSPLWPSAIETADFFHQRIEFLPYEHLTGEQVLDELNALAQDGFLAKEAVAALANLSRGRMEEWLAKLDRLPVYPAVALRALETAADPASDAGGLENLVASDQVLAAAILAAANSSLFAPVRPIAALRQAIAYIGLNWTRKVVLATSFRPLFASAALRMLWRHSLEMAELCEQLACLSRCAEPEQAFLAGLIHDIGRLAALRLGGPVAATYARLLDLGCEPVFIEHALFGFDHGAAGAEGLQRWFFPDSLVDGVRHHHQPEQSASPVAALLYLGEFLCAAEEDLPSLVRLTFALQRVDLTYAQLVSVRPAGAVCKLFNHAA